MVIGPDARIPLVLIVEDHPLVADSLVSCVRDCNGDIDIVIAESIRAALDILGSRPSPALIVTDLTLTDAKGTEAVRHLRRAAPGSPLLVFSALADQGLQDEARQLGALAYLIKSTSIQALREQIRAVVGSQPAEAGEAAGGGALSRLLTPKQIAVLEELSAGRSNKEIAARLCISDQTVGSHVKEILGRLAVKNRTEAVVRYIELTAQSGDRPRR